MISPADSDRVNATQFLPIDGRDYYSDAVRKYRSHQIFYHPDGRRTAMPFHAKDLKKGTLKAILKPAGISLEGILKIELL